MTTSYGASGDLYGALLDVNKQKVSGFVDMGEASPVSITVKLKQKKQKSARKGMRGQTTDSGARIDEVIGSLGIQNWIAKNIAMLLSGTAVAATESLGTVTAEAITLPADGSWIKLAHRDVSSVLITDKAEDTDFEVKPRAGLIRSLGAELTGTAAYSYAAESGYKIDIATKSAIRMALIIDGKNDETDEDFYAELDSVVFVPKSPMLLISAPETDYEKMEFDLIIETLPGKTSPGSINGFAIGS